MSKYSIVCAISEGNFNFSLTTQGLDSGFQGGEDDMYTVYDKPWRQGGGAADKIYRPSKNVDKDVYGDDVEKLIRTNKYVCSV